MLIFNEEEQYKEILKNGFAKFINIRDLTILSKFFLKSEVSAVDCKKVENSEVFATDCIQRVKNKLIAFCTNWDKDFRPIKYDDRLNKAIQLAIENKQIYQDTISFTSHELDFIRDSNLTLWEQKLLFILFTLAKWQQHRWIYLNSDSVIQIRDLKLILGLNLKDSDTLDLLHSLYQKRKIIVLLKPILKVEINYHEEQKYLNPMSYKPWQEFSPEDDKVLEFRIGSDMSLYFDKIIGEKIFQCECCGKLFKPAAKARYAKRCSKCAK